MFSFTSLLSADSGNCLVPESNILSRRKVFVHRRARDGSLRKICSEKYTRDDVECGLAACKECKSGKVRIPDGSPSETFTEPHLLLVDSSTLMDRFDALLDEKHELFTDIIIPQAVYKEVNGRSVRRGRELRDTIYTDEKRRWHIFYNQFHPDTFDDSPLDYVREAHTLVKCAKFYQKHCVPLGIKRVIILTDEQTIVDFASQQGLYASTVRDYISALKVPRADLLDKLGIDDESKSTKSGGLNLNATIGSKRKRGAVRFAGHLNQGDMRRGLAAGKYIKGTFQVSRDNYLEAYVYPSVADTDVDVTSGEQVLVQGLLNCNRAIQGDLVCLEMLPKNEWSRPARELRMREFEESTSNTTACNESGEHSEPTDGTEAMQVDSGDAGDAIGAEADADFVDDDALLEDDDRVGVEQVSAGKSSKPLTNALPTARVVGILKRNWRPYCGILLLPSGPSYGFRHLFSPAEKRVPRVRVECRQAESLRGKRIMVAIDDWPADSRYPRGHYLRTLGDLGDRDTENEVLLLEHDVPHEKFNADILSCLPKMPWIITDADLKVRRDLRHLDICSVDPPGCTDIDDALHCRPVPDNEQLLEVGVHIADVSHFVRPGNAMDLEASKRGTTVYLTDRRIDMLPDLLSSNLCSLRGNEDRFAFSVIWHIDPENVSVQKVDFCKSLIRSRSAFTYKQAQERIDDLNLDDPLTTGLRRLNNLAKRLKSKRTAQGALKLASVEIRFKLDSETHDPIGVQEKEPLDTHSLVEEFMLLANMAVARKICDEYPDCAVLRRHPVPNETNYKPLLTAAAARGISLRAASGKELSDSLDCAVVKDNPYFNTVLRILTTRCMTQAVYFAAGSVAPADYVHYGLAAAIYTHFTSPIRRYADLMVHRLLAAAIGADETFPSMLEQLAISRVCENLNYSSDAPFTFAESASDGAELRWAETGVIRSFDKITVRISLDTSDVQHNRLKLELVEPSVEGFSVQPVFEYADKPIL